jgi:uncharacterized protein (TIGR03086 family)
MPSDAELGVLSVAVDQAAGLLARVPESRLDDPTPCTEWTVGRLVDHLVNTPSVFTTIMRGEQPDWGAAAEHVGADRERRFRAAGDELVRAWTGLNADADRASRTDTDPTPLAWQLAELAVHTWDLATALGVPTGDLDPAVAERGLAFMSQRLTSENRGPVFGPEQPAPADADAYARIAAFAGRRV